MNRSIRIINKDKASYRTVNPVAARYIDDNSKFFDSIGNDYRRFADGVHLKDYRRGLPKDTRSKPIIILFETEGFDPKEEFILTYWSNKEGLTHSVRTASRRINLYNLYPNREYMYEISSSDGSCKSETKSFFINDTYRLIYTPKSLNLRDIGGKITSSGKTIKYGLVYRGCELTRRTYRYHGNASLTTLTHNQLVHKCDLPYYYDLGFTVDLDFRGKEESNFIEECPLNSKEHPIRLCRATVGGYRGLFNEGLSKDEVKERIKLIFDVLANANKEPVYLHCWGGADRTGTFCFMLEALLGVQIKDIVIDYELTAFGFNVLSVKPHDPSFDFSWRKDDNFNLMFSWFLDYLKPGENMQSGMERYLTEGVGVSQETIERIKSIYLE